MLATDLGHALVVVPQQAEGEGHEAHQRRQPPDGGKYRLRVVTHAAYLRWRAAKSGRAERPSTRGPFHLYPPELNFFRIIL